MRTNNIANGSNGMVTGLCLFMLVALSFLISSIHLSLIKNNFSQTIKTKSAMGIDPAAGRNSQCNSVLGGQEFNFSDMIQSTKQVIVAMPAKASGTSLKVFAIKCNGGHSAPYAKLGRNFLNGNHEKVLTNAYTVPHVIASHVMNAKSLINLVQRVPESTLIVYSHRDETSRLISAIKTVLVRWCRGTEDYGAEQPEDLFHRKEGNSCHISEHNLIDLVIKRKPYEMRIGATEILTCATYQAIRDYSPNMVFMDYKKSSSTQKTIGKKYCPELQNLPIKTNVASQQDEKIFVRGKSLDGSFTVPLSDWLETKSSTLEWSLDLHNEATCLAETRKIEHELFGCNRSFVRPQLLLSDISQRKVKHMDT